jgi:hypothetical protein
VALLEELLQAGGYVGRGGVLLVPDPVHEVGVAG